MSTHSLTTAIMPLIRLEAAVILGIVVPQIFSTSISSPPSDCLASVDTCMSDLCKSKQAFYEGICGDDGCRIKGSEVCNMTIQAALDQFPSLRGCVCAWEEEELCDSIQALATQCQPIQPVYDGAGSCFKQMTVCVSDTVCNRLMAPVLQACQSETCDRERCQQETQQFYSSMPHSVAELLVMCECEASDLTCMETKTNLQSGTCGGNTWICQDKVKQCVEDSTCRDLLKTLQTKCWSSEEAQCSDGDLSDQCFTRMDPALILGADPECKKAFLATLGTKLHYPCTCRGVHDDDLLTCNMIHHVFHNRSHFMTSWKSSSGPSKPPEINEPEKGHTWSQGRFQADSSGKTEKEGTFLVDEANTYSDYLLYAFAAVLFVGVVILMPLAVVSKIWMLRRRDKTKFHHPQKSNRVVVI